MTATPDTAPDTDLNAATTSTPRPYTVMDLETFDFRNHVGVPEMGRSVAISDLANYVKSQERKGPVKIWEYTLEYNYDSWRRVTNLTINGKAVPQIWDTAWDSIVFYPERVIVKTTKGIVINPHTLNVDKDGELDRRTFDITKDVRDHVTNENTVAFINNGEIYTQPIDKSAEPTKIQTPWDIKDRRLEMLWITENNTVFYTMRTNNGPLWVYRNDERVGDIPDFDTLENHVLLPDGTLTLQLTLQNGQKITKQIDTSSEPRYRWNWTVAAVSIARAATLRALERVNGLEWVLSVRDNAIDTRNTELQNAQATIAQMQSEIARINWANTDLQWQIADKDGVIANLSSRWTERIATIDGLEGRIDWLTRIIWALQIRFEWLKMRSVVWWISTDDFLAIKRLVDELHAKSTTK